MKKEYFCIGRPCYSPMCFPCAPNPLPTPIASSSILTLRSCKGHHQQSQLSCSPLDTTSHQPRLTLLRHLGYLLPWTSLPIYPSAPRSTILVSLLTRLHFPSTLDHTARPSCPFTSPIPSTTSTCLAIHIHLHQILISAILAQIPYKSTHSLSHALIFLLFHSTLLN